jgi:CHAD domain-containing protein
MPSEWSFAIVPVHTRSLRDVRVHPDEPLPAAIERIATGLADRIVNVLETSKKDPNEAIHTARKSMKRFRGLLRLVRDELGEEAYRRENEVLRESARTLAPARDAFVLGETLRALQERYGRMLAEDAFRHTQRYLSDRHERILEAAIADRQTLATVADAVAEVQARLTDGRGPGTIPEIRDDYAAVSSGLRRVYRRGRRGMHDALDSQRPEGFHEWRKRVKYLRYHMETLQPLWPELIGAQAKRLDELGETLGSEHDLTVLGDLLLREDIACPDPAERWLLVALIHQRRADLRTRAVTLGQSLYAETPTAFTQRMSGYWKSARGRPPRFTGRRESLPHPPAASRR